ncbi:hypothetical protein GGI05_007020, partial [Coemansia sp. RSA 2603]
MHFYEQAGDILRQLEQRRGSVKTLTVGNGRLDSSDKRRMYALICETLAHGEVLTKVLLQSDAVNKIPGLDEH